MGYRFSSYGDASRHPSPVNAMMTDFAGDFRDGVDINLGVGYVNEKTIPAGAIGEALGAVLGDPLKYRQALNYGGAQGSPNLIEALRRFHLRRGMDPDVLARKRIVIGANGATSIMDAVADVLAPGIVLSADPMYYIYCNALERKGFEVVTVPEDEDGAVPERVEAKIAALGRRADAIAFFYFVTVNNPSCSILTGARRTALVELAAGLSRKQGRRIPIVFDQAYELLIHDPEVPRAGSVLGQDDLGIAYELGTLSKVLAPALRIGHLMGSPGPFLDALVQRTSDVGFSAPLVTQEMAGYLLEQHAEAQIEAVNAGYREKARVVREGIARELGAHVCEVRGGRAGFYYYLTFEQIETHTASPFFRFLTRTTGDPAIDGAEGDRKPRVIYVPGEYCVHPLGESVEAGRRQLRLSYGFEEAGAIGRALEVMREAVAWSGRQSG